MNKIALELLSNILEECNDKLDSDSLNSKEREIFLEASAVLSDIILDSVELNEK